MFRWNVKFVIKLSITFFPQRFEEEFDIHIQKDWCTDILVFFLPSHVFISKMYISITICNNHRA